MAKGRLEAFSDGVIAIIITIMVLEMKVPHGDRLQDLVPLLPVFLSYVLSFLYVGSYRCFRSPRDGWAKTISPWRPLCSTAWCC